MGASSCSTHEPFPDHSPCLLYLKDGTCARYKLLSNESLTYKFVKWEQASFVDGGYCLPKGEFEKIIAYARSELKKCAQAKAELDSFSIDTNKLQSEMPK